MDDEIVSGLRAQNYIFHEQIGRGSFATVWTAEHVLSKKEVAVKVIKKAALREENLTTLFMREVSLVKQIDHPFIAQTYDVIENDTHFFLIMEYAQNGNLLTYVNNNGELSEPQARRFFSQIISALEYLHKERYIAHRDLKAENVLLDKYYNIRLIDFGLSNVFSDEAPQLETACGSPAYAAPEIITGKKYTKSADIWSSGILLYAMVAGELPFSSPDVQTILRKVAFSNPVYPSTISPQLRDLLDKLLTKDPERRISIDKIKTHPWFSKNEYEQLEAIRQEGEKGIDREIIGIVASYGLPVKELPYDLLAHQFNEQTSLYKMLQRDILTEKIRDITVDDGSSKRTQTETRDIKSKEIHNVPLAPTARRPPANLLKRPTPINSPSPVRPRRPPSGRIEHPLDFSTFTGDNSPGSRKSGTITKPYSLGRRGRVNSVTDFRPRAL